MREFSCAILTYGPLWKNLATNRSWNKFRIAVALPVAGLSLFAQVPEVHKVEPPGWWAGHSVNPVRVIIRGKHLSGSRVQVDGPGLRAGPARANASGTYLFVDITIQRGAKPGLRSLDLSAGQGAARTSFEVLQPLSRQGRFQGFSSADVFYLIMPDRFANGDPSNDNPLHNRADARFITEAISKASYRSCAI